MHARLESLGMYVAFDAQDGFHLGMYAHGLTEGYSIQIPHEKGEAITAWVLRGKKYYDPDLLHLPVIVHGKSEVQIDVSAAIRGLHRRLIQKHLSHRI